MQITTPTPFEAPDAPKSFVWPPPLFPRPVPQTPQPGGRRGLLGFSVATLAAGLTVPAVAVTTNPDSELLVACDEFSRVEDQILQFDLCIPCVDEGAIDHLWPRHQTLVEQIASTTAETQGGRLAKARAALAVMRYRPEIDSPDYDDLVRSALRDVIAGAAA